MRVSYGYTSSFREGNRQHKNRQLSNKYLGGKVEKEQSLVCSYRFVDCKVGNATAHNYAGQYFLQDCPSFKPVELAYGIRTIS